MKLRIFTLTLASDRPITEDASKLRGFFATEFNEYILLHQHVADKFLYKYPMVQYKVIKGTPMIMGINEGVEVLKEIYDKYDEIRLGDNRYTINERGITVKEENFGLSDKFRKYRFVTPWFSLNQENYRKFYASDLEGQHTLTRKILIGNLLSASKTLEYKVPDIIKADLRVRPKKTVLKGTKVMAFTGTFVVNFDIPDYMGLGKSVSRGFGAVEGVKDGVSN